MYMLDRLEELWCHVKFSKLKKICKRDGRLSNELKNELRSTNTLEEMFDVLSNSPFCNWLEIRILKCMATVAGNTEATQMICIFEECVHCKKCYEVTKYLKRRYINPDHLTVVKAKLNKNAKHLAVAGLIEYCHNLDSLLDLPPNSHTPVKNKLGCLEIHLVIPKYCCLHAYNVIKNCFFKLRPFNIQYIQIGTFDKVYTTDLIKTKEVESLLTELFSSHKICKFIIYIHMYL